MEIMMAFISVHWKQRYRYQNATEPGHTFILDYSYKGRLPAIKEQIVDMALNGSGIRDIARVLQISPTTIIEELKKRPHNFTRSITAR
jgi:transposase-like protein